jgi:TRAP-type C4-dicarboxylate transport system substrate-binding protein
MKSSSGILKTRLLVKRIWVLIGLILLGSVAGLETASAQRKVTIKLASLAPENTPWGKALNRMAKEWTAATNGQVEVVVYHNGIAGDEADVIRKLNLNQIQGGVLSSFGLNLIIPEILTLSVPFVIRNDIELGVILNTLKPELEGKIYEKGFFPLVLAKAGWARIFSKIPVFVPRDLKRQKVGTPPETPQLTQALKTMGYQMVPITLNETLLALNSGMVEAIYQSPIYVGGMQIFGVTKYMASINLAPLMGGIILNQQAWRAIPDQYKSQLGIISQDIAQELEVSITQLEAEVIKTMSNYGLVINQISPEQEQVWYQDINQFLPALLGTIFDRDIYLKIDAVLQGYRKNG